MQTDNAPQKEAVDPNQPIVNRRRGFLKTFGLAGAALSAGALFSSRGPAKAASGVSQGDIDILRLLATAELIEADLWQQYAELGGLTPGQLPVEANPSFKPMNSYQAAFMNLDSDGPQYISSNTLDELSHATFLNAYLQSVGAEPVDLDAFRTLPSSKATGAQQIGRLTNLTKLSVDTSWYTRYRSATNPDLGARATSGVARPVRGSVHCDPPDQRGFRAGKPYPGNRQHRCVPFRVHRARRHQPLCFNEPEGEEPRSAADHAGDRRRRDRPFPGVGGFLGQ